MFAGVVIDLGCGCVVSSEHGVFKKNLKKKNYFIIFNRIYCNIKGGMWGVL
jgi:hypothetical protein